MELIESLKWRYATKAMNGETVPQEKVDRILEAARLAPTSSGLQPFEIIVVTNKDIKEKIKAIAWNQSVITDCSHLLVFAAWDNYTTERINKIFDLTNAIRTTKSAGFEDYRKNLLETYTKRDAKENFTHAAKQAYISLGFALVAAACKEVDSTPMEGFDSTALDTILELSKKGLKSCVLLTLGYRDTEKDWLVNLAKVRNEKSDFITVVS